MQNKPVSNDILLEIVNLIVSNVKSNYSATLPGAYWDCEIREKSVTDILEITGYEFMINIIDSYQEIFDKFSVKSDIKTASITYLGQEIKFKLI